MRKRENGFRYHIRLLESKNPLKEVFLTPEWYNKNSLRETLQDIIADNDTFGLVSSFHWPSAFRGRLYWENVVHGSEELDEEAFEYFYWLLGERP